MDFNSTTGSIQFSSSILSADLDDFLSPSETCILPLQGGMAPAGSVLAPIVPTRNQPKSQEGSKTVAKVTLSDCLACSGCLTTAETVLLETHSKEKLNALLKRKDSVVVLVSLSFQSISSIATFWNVSMDVSARRLAWILRERCGIDGVFDLEMGRRIALEETFREFWEEKRTLESRKTLLSSSCPGFVLLTEKSEAENRNLVASLSSVKSPQAIMGTLLKRILPRRAEWAKKLQNGMKKVVHVAVMPCYDKKLEAARSQLADSSGTPETDIVLTTSELLSYIDDCCSNHAEEIQESSLDQISICGYGSSMIPVSSTSGSFAEYLNYRVAMEIPGSMSSEFQAVRNGDFREASIRDEHGSVLFRFAIANGFRNVRNLLRKIKAEKCRYDYIEMMSCPGGCTNGSGQLSLGHNGSPQGARETLSKVNETYFSYPWWTEGEQSFNEDAEESSMFRTTFQAIAKSETAALRW